MAHFFVAVDLVYCLHHKKEFIMKKNTDVSNFKINRLETVNENISLSKILTERDYFLKRAKDRRSKQFARSEMKVYRIIKKIEKEEENGK